MTVFEAFDAGIPLGIEMAPDNHRAIAALFPHPQGIIFADTGWPGATWHPFHVVEGKVHGDGPWFVEEIRIREIDHGDPLAEAWNRWMAYRASPEGQWATPARAREFMAEQGLFEA
jgi:hypothetical protein